MSSTNSLSTIYTVVLNLSRVHFAGNISKYFPNFFPPWSSRDYSLKKITGQNFSYRKVKFKSRTRGIELERNFTNPSDIGRQMFVLCKRLVSILKLHVTILVYSRVFLRYSLLLTDEPTPIQTPNLIHMFRHTGIVASLTHEIGVYNQMEIRNRESSDMRFVACNVNVSKPFDFT